MEVRRLGAGDHSAILDLWKRAGLSTARPDGRDSREAFARQLETGLQTVLGVERDGELVGVVLAGHDGRKGWINRLAVIPHARRGGVGRRLLDEAEAVLRAEGIDVVAALIEEDNAPSIDLFERAGFSVARHVLYLSKRSCPEA